MSAAMPALPPLWIQQPLQIKRTRSCLRGWFSKVGQNVEMVYVKVIKKPASSIRVGADVPKAAPAILRIRFLPAPDGVGLQDHYAAAWRHVAQRLGGEMGLLGYDLFNEPFPGTLWEPCVSLAGCPEFDAKLSAFNAKVMFAPVMNAQDLAAGLEHWAAAAG